MTFGEGQMVFWEGPNCPKKSILSMQRHRHYVETLNRLEGPNHGFRTFGRGHGPVAPPPPLDLPMLTSRQAFGRVLSFSSCTRCGMCEGITILANEH